MRQFAEWATVFKPFKKRANHQPDRLLIVHFLMISFVLFIFGISLKEMACSLVAHGLGQESPFFIKFQQTLNVYLFHLLTITFLVIGVPYYFWVRKSIKKSPPPPDHPPDPKQSKWLQSFSHELRTPITTIHGYLEALHDGVIEANPQLYESLHQESKRVVQLIEKMNQLQLWQTKGVPIHENSNIHDILVQVYHQLAESARKKGVSITLRMEQGVVTGAKESWTMVFEELIQNAIQFHRGKKIWVTGKIEDKFYVMNIKGKGKYIPQEELNLIFDEFYRPDPSRNRKTGGLGLGLAIVEQVVIAHGGNITVQSDGEFHQFRVFIPHHH
ncbi:sensor histidine kinase [Hazenella coriacea]|uniref:sensor histidine kinase n=1 Tax=Hazenella coriacea TaxID=1179467 RepID=UPI001404C7F5|nr:HAMP domain-containing sensor histidine kinase [Hazenella coriacea]